MAKTTREFFKFFGPLALGIIVIAAWFIHSRTQSHKEDIALRQVNMVGQTSRIVTTIIASCLADTRFLARVTLHALERHSTRFSIFELKHIFIDFAASRPNYFQIRYLDETGHEVIRVDQYGKNPILLPDQALQDKSSRYYFKEAMQAQSDDVYVSNLDLNMEHGKLEIPLRPTLRFSCPVIDQKGKRRGVAILNLDAGALLGQVALMASTPEATTLFCDADGHWFIAPTTEEAWGHLLDRQEAMMGNKFPDAWKKMTGEGTGQLYTRNGLFTFDTAGVSPNAIIPGRQDKSDPGVKGWKIVTQVKPRDLALPWRNMFILLTVLGILLLGMGLWSFLAFRIRESEATERMRESEKRLLAITRTSRNAIVMVDAEDRVTYWNPAAQALFGYDESEAMGRKMHTFITPDSLPNMAIQASNAGPRVMEFEVHNKEGAIIPVELTLSRFKHLGKSYTVGFMRDISNRKQREQALKHSEETARALLNAPTESAMLIDRAGTVLAINEVGNLRLCGESCQAVGNSLFRWMDDEVARPYREAIAWMLSTGDATEFESRYRGRQYLVNAYPVMGERQIVDSIALYVRDVTEQYKAQAALRHSEQRFRDISEAVGEFIWETDQQMTFSFVTDDSAQVLGYAPEELLGSSMEILIPEAFRADFHIWQSQVMDGVQNFNNVEMQTQTRDGSLIWLRMSGVPYSDESGFLGYRGAAMNITEAKQQQESIKTSERKLRALAESAYDAIVMIDNLNRVSFWNHAASKLFGYSEEEALGKDVHDLISPSTRKKGEASSLPPLSLLERPAVTGEIREVEGVDKEGHSIPLELSVAGFRLNDRRYAVATIRDITERKATEAKLRELATTDALTGLDNRRWFMEQAMAEFSRSRRYNRALAMLMLDIDHFKNVNDTHGHDVGDQVLSSLAGIVVGALREADILGRLGGEEFGVLLPETSREAALDVAERVRKAVESTIMRTSAGEIRITISIGVAVMNEKTTSVETLLKDADVALYQAKENGRNRAFIS
ncbi:PAS domain S-box protein [Pseudodesulfovibrio sp.]|uniref:PAS domain S-box protein n=1 Tax=unclassified Pseudodesulfovibrio TaxID=2661612 RepID=UPI003B008807